MGPRKKPIATPEAEQESFLDRLEAPFDVILTEGSIKGAMRDHNAGSVDLWKVAPEVIRVLPGFQPKVPNKSYEEYVNQLAESMKVNRWLPGSVLNGYTAKDDDTGELVIYVIDGHTRLLAVEKANKEGAGIETVPMTIKTKGVSMEDLHVQAFHAGNGRTLSPYEQAVLCKRLLDCNLSEAEVQRRTGVTPIWFDKLMLLMAAPSALKTMVAYEVIAATFAIEMIDEHGQAKALKLIQEAQAKKAGTEVNDPAAAKVRVTHRNLPKTSTQRIQSVAKKFAPKVHTTLSAVRHDPGFASLKLENRELLAELLQMLDDAASDKKPDEVSDGAQQPLFQGEAESAAAAT